MKDRIENTLFAILMFVPMVIILIPYWSYKGDLRNGCKRWAAYLCGRHGY